MRWSEQETLQFVKLYLRHDSLWNPDHALYKLRGKRHGAYNDIAEEFMTFSGIRLDMDEVKSKIKNLRSTYSQEISKILQRGAAEYVPSLKWFKLWHDCFKDLPCNRLKEAEWQDASLQSMTEEDQKTEWLDTGSHKDDGDNDSFFEHSDPIVTENNQNCSSALEDEDEKPLKRIKRESGHATKSKKKKIKAFNFSPTQESTVQSTTESSNGREDEFDIYGKYIASQLRSMDLTTALRVQLEIHRLVSAARMPDGNT